MMSNTLAPWQPAAAQQQNVTAYTTENDPSQTTSQRRSDQIASPNPGLHDYSKVIRLYKTTLCKHFMKRGKCRTGGKCIFAHGDDELRLRHE